MKLDDLVKQITDLIKGAMAPTVTITKSVEQEQRRALFVAMEPDVFDAHDAVTSEVEVEKACNDFNKHCMTANLFHLVETQAVEIQQSFITPVAMTLDDGREIRKGSWLMWMHWPEGNADADAQWDMVKSGEINGISIGARGRLTEINE